MKFLFKIVKSPMVLANPKWQDEYRDRISEEWEDKVLAANAEFKAKLDEVLPKTAPWAYGSAVQAAMNSTHCLLTDSNIGPDGQYQASVNLLTREIFFEEAD